MSISRSTVAPATTCAPSFMAACARPARTVSPPIAPGRHRLAARPGKMRPDGQRGETRAPAAATISAPRATWASRNRTSTHRQRPRSGSPSAPPRWHQPAESRTGPPAPRPIRQPGSASAVDWVGKQFCRSCHGLRCSREIMSAISPSDQIMIAARNENTAVSLRFQ